MSQFQPHTPQYGSEQYDAAQPSQQAGTAKETATAQTPPHVSAHRFETTSYLSRDVRDQIIQRLNQTLADATILQTHARFAHWNVKGMAFHGLHETFEAIVDDLGEYIDAIAERITALGGQAMGTAGMALSSCRLPSMPADVYTGEQFVDVVVERMAVFDASLYQDIQLATRLEDLDTADLLNEVSRNVSKRRWFLEAHRQTAPVGTAGQSTGASTHGPRSTASPQYQ